jgi:hypothetical protein
MPHAQIYLYTTTSSPIIFLVALDFSDGHCIVCLEIAINERTNLDITNS